MNTFTSTPRGLTGICWTRSWTCWWKTVCSARKTIRIAGDDYPAELVKSKLMKLDSSHIEFVFDCISKNTSEIRNIKKYLLAVLFNAPSTINGYYTALVGHDMNTGSWGTPQNR